MWRHSTASSTVGAEEADRDGQELEAHAFLARLGDLVRVGGHLGLGAAVDERDVVGAEAERLARDVDRGVAAADHDDARADRRGGPVLSASMNGSDSQTPASSSPG